MPAPKLNFLDRVLMFLAPQWSLRRMQARQSLALAQGQSVRHYEAASPGHRTAGWSRTASAADLVIRAAIIETRMHARDLIRNNGWAKRAHQVVANNTVGCGIRAKAQGVSGASLQGVMGLWREWAETTECDANGLLTFYGLQKLAMKAIVSDGEVLFRKRNRKRRDNLSIPVQIEVLEADHLDIARYVQTSDSGGPIINGIEFDSLMRRRAYWLFKHHPGSGLNFQASERIPADEVIHIFLPDRPQQNRGISWMAASILNMKDFDAFEDAELMRQKIAACFAAFVTDLEGVGTPIGAIEDRSKPLIETLEPGIVENLPVGKQVTFSNPPNVVNETFATRALRRLAAGLGITYEDLTGDYSQVNFSSARMSRISHWANVSTWQEDMLIPMFCRPVWKWAMQRAEEDGTLPAGLMPGVSWTCPPMPMIEPDKEGLALQRLVRTGAMTHDEMVRERGYDPDTHWDEYAEGLKKLDARGIKLDSDPRFLTQAGQDQPPEPSQTESKPGDTKTPPKKV
jgi:lambda family phage portal protein